MRRILLHAPILRAKGEMDLKADSVQGVLFLTPGQQQVSAHQLWERVIPGDSPDNFQRAVNSPNLMSTASGERDGRYMTIAVQVGRIDITLSAPMTRVDSTSVFPPRIDDVQSAAERIAKLMKSCSDGSNIIRLAIVLDLAKTVTNGTESTELSRYLPNVSLPPGAIDVNIQFNVRGEFPSLPGAQMNRLCSWNAGQLGFFQAFPIHGSNLVVTSGFVGVKIDVNSAPEVLPPAGKAGDLIEDLLRESLAIYLQGSSRLTQ